MVLVLLAGRALAADDADEELLDRLSAAHARVLTAIPGCFRMEGSYTSDYSFGLLGGQHESCLVRGTLRDGVWEGRELAMSASPETWLPARNLARSAFGDDPAAGGSPGWGRYLLDSLPGAVSTQFLERRGDHWALIQTLAGGPRSTNRMLTLFHAGSLRARAVQARVDSPIRGLRDGGHPVRVIRLTMDLVFGADGAPVSEDVDARFGQGVITGTAKVHAEWRSAPCAS